MRTNRRERKDRRRQEQEYRDQIPPLETLPPLANYVGLVPVKEDTYIPRTVMPSQPLADVNDNLRLSRSNLPLIVLAYGLGAIGLGINAWFAWNRGTALIDKGLLSSLGLVTEAMAFYLPDQASRLWVQRHWVGFVFASILFVFLFVSALINGLGFASLNLADTATARAERITPEVADAQRKLDSLSDSRAVECLKRGDKCRQSEKDEQLALDSLTKAREKVSETSDPQIAFSAKLITWLSLGRLHPTAEDFSMLRLLLLTLLPQLGGLVLMVSRKTS